MKPTAATVLQKAHGAVAGWLTYVPKDEFPRALDALDAFVAEWEKLLLESATVIERMANGASRAECSPELDRVIAALREIDGDKENEVDELQKRADEIYAADRAQDYNHMRGDD